MRSLRRADFLIASVIGLMLIGPLPLRAAELRTTLCDRPVCRTVAIVPDKAVQQEVIPEPMHEQPYYDGAGGCDGCCVDSCAQCCVLREGWVEFDFLLGWRHSMRTPPLVTTSPNGTAQGAAGVLPGATIVHPTEPFGEDARPGARITVGTWLDSNHCWALEGRYFMLADATSTFSLASTGNPILARPFFDVIGNAQASRLLAFPLVSNNGRIDITTDSELLGGDAYFRRTLARWGGGELHGLIGYQFAHLEESLFISDLATDADPGNLIADGTTIAITDSFVTRNEYHAGTIGAAMRWQRSNLRWELLGKVGFGNMKETVGISGTTTVTVPGGAAAVNQFGFLAQGANLGTFTQDKFSASPEINVKCIYSVNECLDVSCGYTFLYFTSIAQPGEQIDVDLRTPANQFEIRNAEYWMHAFQCGMTLRF